MVSVALALAAGLALRLWMLSNFFEVNGDSLVYGELAKNLLQHGQYAQGLPGGELHSTLIRLPGYPLFLAGCFHIFGMEDYASAPWLQIAMDLAGCLLLAGFVRLIAPPRLREGAAHCTLWLAALCPFTAIYAAEPLTEAPTVYCVALAMWSVARFRERPAWATALWFTFAVTPDGVLVAVALVPVMAMGLRRGGGAPKADTPGANAHSDVTRKLSGQKPGPAIRMAVVCVLLALAPFAVWTWRNWKVFHVFEPLAPRMANDPGEDTHPGWERWMKTWCLDFVSTYDVYWNVPLGPLEMSKLPARAFDSPAQHVETAVTAIREQNKGRKRVAAAE